MKLKKSRQFVVFILIVFIALSIAKKVLDIFTSHQGNIIYLLRA